MLAPHGLLGRVAEIGEELALDDGGRAPEVSLARPDHLPAEGRGRIETDHGALLHPERPFHPGEGDCS